MASTFLSGLARGAFAGCVATAPMTMFMLAMFRRLPARERYPLPPSEITEVIEETTLGKPLPEPPHRALTIAGHFGYGAATGAIFGAIVRERRARAAWGIGYGLLVWSVSYLGWLPALGVLRSAARHPPRRNALMIGAHVVWGVALASLA